MLDDFLNTLPKGRGSGRLLRHAKFKHQKRAAFALWGAWKRRSHPTDFCLTYTNTPLETLLQSEWSVSKKPLHSTLIHGDNDIALWAFNDHSAIPVQITDTTIRLFPDMLSLYEVSPKAEDGKWYAIKVTGSPTQLRLAPYNSLEYARNLSPEATKTAQHPLMTMLRTNINRFAPLLNTPRTYQEACGGPGENWPDFLPRRDMTPKDSEKAHALIGPFAVWVAAHYQGATSVRAATPSFPKLSNSLTFSIQKDTNNIDVISLDILLEKPLPDRARQTALLLKKSLTGYTYEAVTNTLVPKEPTRLYSINTTWKAAGSNHEKMSVIETFGGLGDLGRI